MSGVAELLEGKRDRASARAPAASARPRHRPRSRWAWRRRGLKVAVLTIDPAKRLANSLGLPELGNEERQVDPERFAEAGLEMRGELWAMMLDAKRTWDEVIERHASDDEDARRRASTTASTRSSRTRWRDRPSTWRWRSCTSSTTRAATTCSCSTPRRPATPSTSSTRRSGCRASWTRARCSSSCKPGRLGLKVFGRGSGMLFSVLKRVTGVDLLRDLSEFFQSFGDMASGIGERAERVGRAARRAREHLPARDLAAARRDRRGDLLPPPAARVEAAVRRGGREPHERGAVGRATSRTTSPRCSATSSAARSRATSRTSAGSPSTTARRSRRLARELRGEPLITVPLLDDDVHDVDGLAAINEYLFELAPAQT